MTISMKTTVLKRIEIFFEYFFSLLFTCGILYWLAGALYILGSRVFYNIDPIYQNQLTVTISIFVPSLTGYSLLRIVDHFLFKKNKWGVLKSIGPISFSKVGQKTLIGLLLFLSAYLISFIIMGAYFALVFILGWAKITTYPPDSYSILDNLIKYLFNINSRRIPFPLISHVRSSLWDSYNLE